MQCPQMCGVYFGTNVIAKCKICIASYIFKVKVVAEVQFLVQSCSIGIAKMKSLVTRIS